MLDRVEMSYVFLKSLYFCPLFYSPCYKAHWCSDLSPYKAPVLLRLSGPYRQRQDIEGFELQSLSSSKLATLIQLISMLDITRSALHFLEVMLDFQKLLFLAVRAFLVEFSLTEERGQGGWQWGARPFPLCWPRAPRDRRSEPLLLLAQPLLPPGTSAASRRVVTGPLLQSDRMGTTNLVLTDRGFWLFKSIVLTLAGKN